MAKKIIKSVVNKPFKSRKKIGKAPGTVAYFGTKKGIDNTINVLSYNVENYSEQQIDTPKELIKWRNSAEVVFYDIVGLGNEGFITSIGEVFELGPLLLEDVVDTAQRPKIDEYEDSLFGTFKMLYINKNDELVIEHIALVLEKNNVLFFQETEEDVFEGVKDRIRSKYGRIRSRGADYLFFALLDAMIDNYYVVLEYLKNKIEVLEEEVFEKPTEESGKRIQMLKKEVLKVRKWVLPVKELVNRIVQTEHPLIQKDTRPFLRDALDRSTEINEDLALYREMSASLMEMHMTNMSNKMNEVMKVLTVMASIFIPLTFFAGIYGMNFEYMPELKWEYSYFVLWGIFILIFIGMLMYFKKKGWL